MLAVCQLIFEKSLNALSSQGNIQRKVQRKVQRKIQRKIQRRVQRKVQQKVQNYNNYLTCYIS